MSESKIFTALAALYIAGFVLTFGWGTAHEEHNSANNTMQQNMAGIAGVLYGLTWPIYWPLRGSYLFFNSMQD